MNIKAITHAAVLLHNLGLSACSIKLLAAAGHKVSEEIKQKIAMIEHETVRRNSLSQSCRGKKKRAKLRNYKQKLHDEKYDEKKDNADELEDDYQTDMNLPNTSQKVKTDASSSRRT